MGLWERAVSVDCRFDSCILMHFVGFHALNAKRKVLKRLRKNSHEQSKLFVPSGVLRFVNQVSAYSSITAPRVPLCASGACWGLVGPFSLA